MEGQQTAQATAMVTPPPSPGVGPFRLKECIEELLKFTLTSSINGDLHLGLSTDYCSHLLQHDPTNPLPLSPADHSKGVPMYPLYKHLATSLQLSISGGALFPRLTQREFTPNGSPFKSEEDDWTKLIMEEGSELLNVLTMVDFELHVQEPYFSQLKDGYKIVEGRCAVGNYNRIAPGSFILFNKSLLLQVQDCNHYASFHEMLETEGLQRVLPGVKTLEEGVQVYRNFYPEERKIKWCSCYSCYEAHISVIQLYGRHIIGNGVCWYPEDVEYGTYCGNCPGETPPTSICPSFLILNSAESTCTLNRLFCVLSSCVQPASILSTILLNSFIFLLKVRGSSLTEGARALANL